MKRTRNILLIFILGIQHHVHAQIGVPGDELFSYYWLFEYDQSGNRTMRQLQSTEEEPSSSKSNHGFNNELENNPNTESQKILKNNKLFVYPNPFIEDFNIEYLINQNATIKIFTSSGQQIYEKKISAEVTTINASHFAPGLYYLLFIPDNGSIEKRKILKLNL